MDEHAPAELIEVVLRIVVGLLVVGAILYGLYWLWIVFSMMAGPHP